MQVECYIAREHLLVYIGIEILENVKYQISHALEKRSLFRE